MNVRFTWDPNKAESNKRKHKIGFEQASRVFADPSRLSEVDRIVDVEERWLTIGAIDDLRIVVVAHTVTDAESIEIVRIISARKAERHERRRYEREEGDL
jgi:uncharacterized DUF497 family protein